MLRLLFILILAVPVAAAVLFETDTLMRGLLPATPDVLYAASLAAIVAAFGGCYLSLRLFAFNAVKRQMADADPHRRQQAVHRWTTVRLGIWGVALWVSTFFYYAVPAASASKYCILVAFATAFFCWPAAEREG